MIYTCLSVRQPWASLIASGKKTLEIRNWKTDYRGTILICSSKFKDSKIDNKQYPLGVAICLVDLVDIIDFEAKDCQKACLYKDQFLHNHYAWKLTNIRKINPIPIKGKLKLFTLDI